MEAATLLLLPQLVRVPAVLVALAAASDTATCVAAVTAGDTGSLVLLMKSSAAPVDVQPACGDGMRLSLIHI